MDKTIKYEITFNGYAFNLYFIEIQKLRITTHSKIRMSLEPIKSIRTHYKETVLLKNVILIPGPLSLLEYQMFGYHSK